MKTLSCFRFAFACLGIVMATAAHAGPAEDAVSEVVKRIRERK